MRWVVVTNSNTCKIYAYPQKGPKELKLLTEFSHPENRNRNGEITADKAGEYRSGNGTGGTYAQATDPKEVLIESFSKEIAEALDSGRKENQYQNVIMVGPAKMIGLINKNLNDLVKEKVSHQIDKNVMQYTEAELLNFVNHQTALH